MATYKIGKGRYTLPTGLPQDVLEQAIEEIYATHEATRQGSLGYSVDNAQKMLGKGAEAFGRFTGIDALENYGSDVVKQQEKDLEEGRYVSDYQGSFTDQDGAFKKLGWTGEKILENLATSGVALGGSVAALAAAPFSASAATLIGVGTLGTNLVMSTGESALEAEDKTGDYSAGGAIATGGIVAFLDRFGAKIPKDKIANMTGKELVDELVAKGYTKAASELVKTVTKKAVKEGATEAAQENVIMTGAALQGGDYSLDEVINKNIDSFVVGAGMGAGQSVASGGVKRLVGTGDVAGEPVQQETAAASFAQRLDTIANEGQPTDDGTVPFNLNDVDRMSDNGARAVMDVAHTRIATEIKQLSKVLRDKLSGKERADFEKEIGALSEYVEIKDNDVVLSAAELRSSKNKTKSAITTGGYNAVSNLVGDTREGQELLNLLRESQILTSLHNKGYVGGLSQYTEGLNPFQSQAGYGDRSSLETVGRLGLSAAAGSATGGATVAAQLGAVGGARAVDAMTGSRSRVNKFVNQNKDGAPLTASGQSFQEDQFQAEQDEIARNAAEEAQKQAQADADAQQQSQNAQETAQANRAAGQRNAPPTLESPQWTMETATGLDKNGVAMALRMLERLPSTPVAIRKAIDSYRKTVDTGGKVTNLSPLIRFVNATANENPQFIQRVSQPDTGVEQQQVQVDKTEAYKQTEGYRRGIEANQKAGSDLNAAMNADKSISRIDKAKLGSAIQQLQLNLGENPLQAVQSIVSDLSKSGISQELLQKYITPYADRVARQQPKPDVPTFDDRVVPVPYNNKRMQDAFGVTEPTLGGNYINLDDNNADVTGTSYTGGTVAIVDGKPVLETNDIPSEPATKDTGWKTKVNLFKKKAGWSWVDSPRTEETIVSTETRGKHHYSLATDFQTPVTLETYPNQTSEPRLRPSTYGEAVLGKKVGTISVRGKPHPVYDKVSIVPKGGNTLKVSNERLERAKQQGFDTDKVHYHASKQDISEFKAGYSDGLIFLTPDAGFATKWLGKGKFSERNDGTGSIESVKAEKERWRKKTDEIMKSMSEAEREKYYHDVAWPERREFVIAEQNADNVIYPVVTKVKKTFKPDQDYKVLEELYGKAYLDAPFGSGFPTHRDAFKDGNYLLYENKEVVDFLKSKGYDSMFLKESAGKDSPFTTLAVFNPSDIRSVNAKFDPDKVDSPLLLDDRTKESSLADSDPFNIGKDMERTILGMYPTEGVVSPFTVKSKVEGIKKLFSELYVKTTGTTDPIEQTPENLDRVARTMATEALKALEQDSNAIGWYDRVLDRAMTIMRMIDPDVAATPELETTFKYALAVTSNGMAVDQNFEYAADVFDFYKQNGRLPETKKEFDQGGDNNKAMLQSFNFFNSYQDVFNRGGTDIPLQDFLSTDFRRGDLDKFIKQFNKEHGTDLKVGTAEGVDVLVKGSYVMGPKIGQGFYQNLTGNYDPLTTDIWWMRMWNRHTGRPLEPRKSEAHMEKSKAAIVDKIKQAKKGSMQFDIVKAALNSLGEKKAGLYTDDARFHKFLAQLQREGNKWYKNYKAENGVNPKLERGNLYTLTKTYNSNLLDQPQETPKDTKERQYMREVTARAIDLLGSQGVNITTADFQALMWYPEKRLFKMIGVQAGNGSDNDYEDAARLLATQRGISNERVEEALAQSTRGSEGVDSGSMSSEQDGRPDTRTDAARQAAASPALTIPTYDDFSGSQETVKNFPPVSKTHFVKAKQILSSPAFNIGKEGDPLEHGVNDPYVLSLVARAFDTRVEYVSNQAELNDVTDAEDMRRMRFNSGWNGRYAPKARMEMNTNTNSWGFIREGGGLAIIKERAANEQMKTAVHEVGHGITMYSEDGAFDRPIKNPINNRRGKAKRPETVVDGSFQAYFFDTIMALPKKERDAVIKEITYVQRELLFSTQDMREQGEGTPFRVASEGQGYANLPYARGQEKRMRRYMESAVTAAGFQIDTLSEEQTKQVEKFVSEEYLKKDKEFERGYMQNTAESIVDPFMYILTDPKQAKKDIPKFYKMAKEFFNSSGSPLKFFSAILALVIATEEEEEERNLMAQGALSPQGQGALAMV